MHHENCHSWLCTNPLILASSSPTLTWRPMASVSTSRVTPETALRLAKAVGRSAESWLAVQDAHDRPMICSASPFTTPPFRPTKMPKSSCLATAVAALALTAFAATAAQPNKCVIHGTVTYQQEACPNEQVRKPPAIQKPSVEENRHRAAATPSPSDKLSPSTPTLSSGFRCDGRQHCSQMKSCAEATYFLANCPGVKMDGDKNGIPCEQQWCSR